MPKTIQILNPVPNGSRYTNLRRANSFVRGGRAKWEGGALRFLDDTGRMHLCLLIERKVRTQDQAGYDSIGLITLDQAQGLPLAGPAERLFSKGGRFTPKHDSCRTISKISLK